MSEHLKGLLEKITEYEDYIIWSFIFGLIHTFFSSKNRTVISYFISFVTSVPIGVLAGMSSHDAGYSGSTTYVITAIAALTAQDVVKFVLGVSGFLRDKVDTISQTVLEFFINRFRKGKGF